jgi:Autophagy protein Atg8 ubiquitin like
MKKIIKRQDVKIQDYLKKIKILLDKCKMDYNAFRDLPIGERQAYSWGILNTHKDRIPIIIISSCVNKWKFLAHDDMLLEDFWRMLRKHLNIRSYESYFILTEENIMPYWKATMRHLHNKYKNKDNFLYLYVIKDQAFG